MHPPQQPTPQPPPIPPGQHVSQGPVMTMAYFVQQQQTYPAPPHAQQAIGKMNILYINSFYCILIGFQHILELQWV